MTSEAQFARRPPAAQQPGDRFLRRQPDLDRGRHTNIAPQREREGALRGVRLARRQVVDFKKTGEYIGNKQGVFDAIEAAKVVTDKPSLIIVKTIIMAGRPPRSRTRARSTDPHWAPTSSLPSREVLG